MRVLAITTWVLSTILLGLHDQGAAAANAKPALRGLAALVFEVP